MFDKIIHLTEFMPSEFKPPSLEETKLADEILGPCGRLLSASKSGYRKRHPNNNVIFNANIGTDVKLWYGDIDLTIESDRIQNLANFLGKRVYVLYEMDWRFKNETNPNLKDAVAVFEPKNDI
jgi:hypothetical protein